MEHSWQRDETGSSHTFGLTTMHRSGERGCARGHLEKTVRPIHFWKTTHMLASSTSTSFERETLLKIKGTLQDALKKMHLWALSESGSNKPGMKRS